MPVPDDATPSTSFFDAAVLAELARQARDAVREATGTDEHRAIGEVVRIRPARAIPRCGGDAGPDGG